MKIDELNKLLEEVPKPLSKIEAEIGMPKTTLQKAIKGERELPKKWTIRLKDYVARKQYLVSDPKNATKKTETTQIKDFNQQTTGTKDLTKPPPKSNYTINTAAEEKVDLSKLTSFQLYQRKKLGLK